MAENNEDKGEISKGINFATGDYRIHVFIEEGRALLPPGGAETTDPMVVVRIFGKEKGTSPLEDIGGSSTIYWGEHMFFEVRNMTHTLLEDEKLTIYVRDHNTLFKDSLIGLLEVDLIYVYSQPKHAIVHKWVVLSNPTAENFDVMRGYLKVGVSVLHHADDPVDLAMKESLSDKDKDIMLPPHVKPKVIQLVLQLLKAESLPVMDKGDTIDAYVIGRFAGSECRSSVQVADKATMSAYWYEEFLMPVMLPCVTKTISLTFYDHDAASAEDLVGSINLHYGDIRSGMMKSFFWGNLYGGPPLISNQEADQMCQVPEAASHWRGRVLLRAWLVEDADDVFKKTRKLKEEGIKLTVRDTFETGSDYEIRCQVFSGSAMPLHNNQLVVKVAWSGATLLTQPQKNSNGNVFWFETLKRQLVLIPTAAERGLPDVFVYLVYDGKCVCFARLPVDKCMNKLANAEWVSLIPDKAVGKIKEEWNAGFLRIRLYVGMFDEDNDEQTVGKWNQDLVKPPMQQWVLLNHIFQCQDLPPSDKNGLADPYITVYCGGNTVSSKDRPKENTLNPRWYHSYQLPIEVISIEEAPPIIIYIYDHDDISSDDIIGVSLVNLIDASSNTETAPRPKWYDVKLGRTISQGKILASFTLARPDAVPKFKILPAFVDKTVELNILGLRDLKPAVGWLPVNKAFVRIDLNSLDLPDTSQGVRYLETQPFQSGNNPNINSCLSFRCKIPNDPLFAPTLTCTVHDYLFAGLSQPLIGSFTINLGEFVYKKREAPRKKLMGFVLGSKLGQQAREEEKGESAAKVEDVDIFGISKPSQSSGELKNLTEIAGVATGKRSTELISIEQAIQNYIVLFPQFQVQRNGKKKEVNMPNAECYIAIGYNRVPEDGLKQYRFFVNSELEETSLLDNPPFEEFNVRKGQSRGLPDVIDGSGDSSGSIEITGKLKAKIRVVDYPAVKQTDSDLDLVLANITEFNEDAEFEKVARQLLKSTKCVVRVYVLNAFDLEQKDRHSHSDPYLRLKLGKKVIDDHDNWKEDCPTPQFNKMFEFSGTLPGVSMLKIQLWDYNSVFSDTKIGTAKIDLEDRYFSRRWMLIKDKPVETRSLHLNSSRVPQGYVRLWVDIHEEGLIPDPIDLTPRPPMKFEARVIIWRSKGIENADAEGVSDLYVRAWIDPEQEKETDTHYRCAGGTGSWNWRMKFPLELPQESNLLTVQVWDRDILSGNDFIGEATIPYNELAQQAWDDNIRIKMKGQAEGFRERLAGHDSEKFWFEMKKRDEDGNFLDAGKILISFELVPESRAAACPVGEGRDQPNVDPMLPAPIGRFEFSLNPLKMISQLCGPEFKAKICCLVCCALCLLMLLFMAPILFSDAISAIIFS